MAAVSKVSASGNAARWALIAGYSTAIQTYLRVYSNPQEVEGGASKRNLSGLYLTLWSYYDNSAFEDALRWSSYKGQYKLYRQMRSLYNPTRRLVDFYAGSVYPGILSADGAALPDGARLAIPFAADTPPELTTAISQFWRWSNWQANKSVFVRYGAVTGNVLVEVLDNLDSGTVSAHVVWPGLVAGLDLDPAGNVKAYALQYLAFDDMGFQYVYRKEVDSEWIRTYRNAEPYDYNGEPGERPNPYGFVPAVWAKHRDIGGNYGAPAIHGSIGKIDELNSLASHIHDQVHKVIGAPALISGEGNLQNLYGKQSRRPAENDYSDPIDTDRDSVLLLKMPPGATVQPLIGNLNLAEALTILQALQAEIEADHPELALYRDLRAMSQLTGPAADRVMGDVGNMLSEAASNYDQASIALFQMAVAIGGWRANNGDWGPVLTRHQQRFLPFDLDSYAAGDLDLDILPRALITMNEFELLELQQLRDTVKAATPVTVAAALREALPT